MPPTISGNADYAVFVVSIDDVEWTRHWLGGKRCDQLIISIAKKETLYPQIRIRAVESKATSRGEPIDPNPATEPFSEGLNQVIITLEALWSILAPSGVDQLVEDLRFSSFMEHLASVVLSELYPFEATDSETVHIVRVVSELSRRSLSLDNVVLDGAVVCTQYRTAVAHKVVRQTVGGETREWSVLLIRAGTRELDTLIGPITKMLAVDIEEVSVSSESHEGVLDSAVFAEPVVPLDTVTADSGETSSLADSGASANTTEASPHKAEDLGTLPNERGQTSDTSTVSSANSLTVQLANDLYIACHQRGFPVEQPVPTNIVVGPTLLTISMALQSGADLQPIQRAVQNLAREVGVASITVENDPQRPFHVRFLVARRDRQFPSLPSELAPVSVDAGQSYLGIYLGQDIEGKGYLSYASTWPHMLVGGTTGSGKTTFIRSILRQLAKVDSGLVKAIVIDGKSEVDYYGVLSAQHFVPRFPEVLLGHEHVIEVFEWLVKEEIPARRQAIRDRATKEKGRPRQARELYIESVSSKAADPFEPLIVIVDEFADIMISSGNGRQRFEQLVQQVAQVGRSMLVHLILATQRPDASVVSGGIKVNLPTRVALRLPTFHDSTTILGGKGAESLLGSGDLIFVSPAQPPIRLQGYSD